MPAQHSGVDEMSANLGIDPTKNEAQHDDRRAMWERPALRRLAVDKAEHGSSRLDDGQGGGGGPGDNHS
jgi:hypothetical protein